MSLNNSHAQDRLIDDASFTKDVTASSDPSHETSATLHTTTSTHDQSLELPGPTHNGLLDVPSRSPSRRPSVQSAYSLSDLSELSYHPSAQFEPLIRPDSNASQPPYTPRSRFMRKLHSIWVTNYGALLVLAAQLFGCLMNLATRLLETPGEHGEAMHPFQILFARQGITAAVCITYAVYTKSIPYFPFGPKGVRWLLVLRGLGGFFGVFGLYFSLLYLPLSEATVLTFLGPILTCYICSLVLTGETFTRQQQMAAFVSLAGVVLIARPFALLKLITSDSSPDSTPSSSTFNASLSTSSTATLNATATATFSPSNPHIPPTPTPTQHLTAIGISLIGVLGATCAMTSIRAIGTRAHPFISINYFSVWCTIVSLASLIIFPEVTFRLPGNWTEWGLLASLGACGFIMQWLLTEGLAYGSASNAKVTAAGAAAAGDEEEQGRNHDACADMGGRRKTQHGLQGTGRTRGVSAKNRVIKGAGTRATSMVYTQMLFALAGDKVVFGVIPTALSWLGSGLILAGAVWVAAARDQPGSSDGSDVEESGGGGGGASDVWRSDADRRRESLAGGGMELNAVAANAVGFGAVSVPLGPREEGSGARVANEERAGLMDDVDDLDEIYEDDDEDDDDENATGESSPSGSNSSSSNRAGAMR